MKIVSIIARSLEAHFYDRPGSLDEARHSELTVLVVALSAFANYPHRSRRKLKGRMSATGRPFLVVVRIRMKKAR